MKVTKVIITAYMPKISGICAEATIVLDNCLAIHKITVCKGERGYFISMPNTGQTKFQSGKKRFEDLVHPLNKGLNEQITTTVLEAFNKHEPN